MREYVLLIGLDEPEQHDIIDRIDDFVIAHIALPRIMVRDGQLYAEAPNSPRLLPVKKVVYHGIYDDDMDIITGLALWGGPCLPNPFAMMNCRLKFPCLVRALQFTQFGDPRGYAAAHTPYSTDVERVAKWGNWHCGENKERFTDSYTPQEPSIIEHYYAGQAVRVVIIGEQHWQIKLEGDDWLKSIHHGDAHFMDVDADLLADTRRVQAGFGLDIIANDYIVGDDRQKHLLEVNHIPNVTRFPEIWEAYREMVVAWLNA
ncbi:MAG: hypothetical protein AAFU54_24895 [Chloroflexota bacterium]